MQPRTNCLKRLALPFACSRFVALHASVRALSLGNVGPVHALACHGPYAISKKLP